MDEKELIEKIESEGFGVEYPNEKRHTFIVYAHLKDYYSPIDDFYVRMHKADEYTELLNRFIKTGNLK